MAKVELTGLGKAVAEASANFPGGRDARVVAFLKSFFKHGRGA